MDIFDILILISLLAVLITLGFGMYAMFRGGDFARSYSNKLMRLRVLLQFIAVLILVAAFYFSTEAEPMVRLTRIYTRTGDGGDTMLSTGETARKSDLRVEAYGAVDEANACIGIVRLHTAGDARLDAILARVQNELFDLGADLSTPERGVRPGVTPLRITDEQTARLEREIDALNEALAPLSSFVLPGGSTAAAYLHLARTVCRRAERIAVSLMDTPSEEVSGPAFRYLNRLSDLLFVAARWANAKGEGDVLWKPGATRDV